MDFLRLQFPDARVGDFDEGDEYDDDEEEEEEEEDFDDEGDDDDEDEDDDDDEEDRSDSDESYEILTVEDFVDHVLGSLPTVEVEKTFLATVEAFTGSEVARVIRSLQEERRADEERRAEGGDDDHDGDDDGGAAVSTEEEQRPDGAPESEDDAHRAPVVRMQDLIIQLRFARHTMSVARRVTRILNALGVDALEELVIHCEDDGRTPFDQKFGLVDHYLTSLKSHPDIEGAGASRPLVKVHLDCLSADPVAWTTFADRHPSMESLSLGDNHLFLHNFNPWTVAALADSMGRLSNLQSVVANLNVFGSSYVVHRFLRGLLEAPQLETLSVQFDDFNDFDPFGRREENDRVHLRDSVNDLACLVPTLKSLKTFHFQFHLNAVSSGVDCLVLLDKAVDSSTLESVELCDLSLCNSTADPQSVATNQSLRDIKIRNATLSRDFWTSLPRFENLRSIHIDCPMTTHHGTSWAGLFRTLPKLESFAVTNPDDHRITHDQEIAAIADNLDHLPLLRNLTLTTKASPYSGGSVEFPALARLLGRCKGALDLDHDGCGNDNARFLSAGISEAQHLTHLSLRVAGLVLSAASVALILGGLERNSTLQSFDGIFEVSAPMVPGEIEAVVKSLLSANSTLQTFGLRVYRGLGGGSEGSSQLQVPEAIAAGFAHNQSIKTLKHFPTGTTALLLIRGMLMKNVTLQFVEGIDDSDVSWILTLNQYKRRLLLHPEGLPEALWTQVLGRIVEDKRSDVMFHFLKRLPSSILQGLQRP